MPDPTKRVICYVTGRGSLPPGLSLGDAIRRAIVAGVDWVQIREKDLTTHELAGLARDAVAEAAKSSTRFLINDRLDVAIAESAGGIHLGSESMPVDAVKRWCRGRTDLPPGFLIGRSCHSLEETRAAEADGADYIFFGPVFSTPAKEQFGPPQGAEKLAAVCSAVRIPVLAIGGINLDNAAECFRAGATGIAAIRLFQQPMDLTAIVRGLKEAL